MLAIALYRGDKSVRLVEHPEPGPPGSGELLCRTLELGVCGTDREIVESAAPAGPEGEDYLLLGHECLARVEAVGPNVTGWQNGDLVVPTVRRAAADADYRIDMLSLGEFQERGIFHLHGFSAPLWRERPRYLYRIRPELAPYAVLTEPLAVAEKGIHEAIAVQQARLGKDFNWGTNAKAFSGQPATYPRVLVTGLGPIAFAAVIASRCRGWKTTIAGRDAADTYRARLATQFGATYRRQNESEISGENVDRDGYDLVLECTGSDEVLIGATRLLASRGVMVWLGSSRTPEPKPLDVAQMMRDGVLRNHIHIGSVNAAPRDFEAALAHLEQLRTTHAAALSGLITDRVTPQEAPPHFSQRQPQGIKTVIEYEC